MRPKCSIVIPSLGNLDSLRTLFESLVTVDHIGQCQILLVINPKQNLLPLHSQFLQLLPNLTISTSEIGVNNARNLGIKSAVGEIILFLDDDCSITNRFLIEDHLKFHREKPWAFAVGGYYKNPYNSDLHLAYHNIQRNWLLQNIHNSECETNVLLGGHFSVKNGGEIPLFDNKILYGGSETEYFFRLRGQGYRLFLAPIEVEHRPKLSVSILAKKARLQAKTHARLMKENIFIYPKWKKILPQNSRHEILYHKLFNQEIRSALPQKLRPILKNPVEHLHETICFYLENRKLF